ncbi:flagellar biosynthesis protein FlhF [Burkholderia multivorans]
MNIRKFTGATSRDALRLAREALGHDAVVLSNRTLDDGSVEIVALADAELAAIAPPVALPKDALAASGGVAALPGAAAQALRGGANPYANGGMPDVFSSVFGASAETVDASAGAAGTAAAAAPGGTSEPAPWLVEHAKRLTQQREALLARPQPVAPVLEDSARATRDAMLGDAARGDASAADAAPEWARDIVRNVARRFPSDDGAAQRPADTPAAKSADKPRGGDAASVADAVKARIERIVNETVMHELNSMRGMMEEQFAGLMWRERQRRSPAHAALTKHLFAAGFSAQLVQMMVDNMPHAEGEQTLEQATEWAQSVLASNLPVLESEDALMERGGVFALMGPTGVGKTTTTAKLAARCVMRFGASKVALLSTDSYRIGGHEQLRIFGKILGVPVHAVKDGVDLQLALSELRNKHIVLIDTIGMSQRDRALSDQIAMLRGADTPVQRLLLLNATSHGDTLNEVVQAYRSAADQPDLAGCILTKLDEATHLGGVLDTVIRYKLPVHYVSTGQKVPENLYVATRKFLLKSAFCVPRDGSPFVPQDEDMPTVLSALTARSTAELHEVRFG